MYGKARVAAQEHCPIADLLGPPPKESAHLEYKATLRTHADTRDVYEPLETATLKTIAAFLNSEYGGTLLLGVNDDGELVRLDADLASLHKDGKDGRDLFGLHLNQIVRNAVGDAAATKVSLQIQTSSTGIGRAPVSVQAAKHHTDILDRCRLHEAMDVAAVLVLESILPCGLSEPVPDLVRLRDQQRCRPSDPTLDRPVVGCSSAEITMGP